MRIVDDLEAEAEPGTISRRDVATSLVGFLDDTSRDGRAIVITN